MLEQRFMSLVELSQQPTPSWLIEDLFERSSLVMLAGASYSFKSFILIDWLLCMASGRSWCGRKTAEAKVAYILGEGKTSLLKRVRAWMAHNELSEEEMKKLEQNFKVSFQVPQLASKASTDNLLADIEREGFKPEVIAIDTFARSMVGLDENDAKDTGLWIESADRLRQLGYAVVFVHHTKKSTEFGPIYRGSSAIIGAMDTAMTLERSGESATLKIVKQKDHDEGPPIKFRQILMFPKTPYQSCVLVQRTTIDSRFDDPEDEGRPAEDANLVLAAVMEDGSLGSDAERARILARRAKISYIAAQSRVSRANKRGKA